MPPARATFAALAILVLVLAGCGPFGGKSEEEKAGDTLTELVQARNEGDYARVCELISVQDLKKFKQEPPRRRRSGSRRSRSRAIRRPSMPPSAKPAALALRAPSASSRRTASGSFSSRMRARGRLR
jgi:hypothetical protein